MKKRRLEPSEQVVPPNDLCPRPEDVAVQAYALYEQRGRQDGHDLDDWLAAEVLVYGGRFGRPPGWSGS